MANEEHLSLLKRSVKDWNNWRDQNRDIIPNLTMAKLIRADLRGADLYKADLTKADLSQAHLSQVQLSGAFLIGADLSGASLNGAFLSKADLVKANLSRAFLAGAFLIRADLTGADLTGAFLIGAFLNGASLNGADLSLANLTGADLAGADLTGADLTGANLSETNLSKADLTRAQLVETNIEGADFNGCRIYGISAWNLKGNPKSQLNLIVTPDGEPDITVDDIEVAQFIYLMLNNTKIRNVIDTITSKAVLILGRFGKRLEILKAIQEELRQYNYLPIVFDFDGPTSRDIEETVVTLAHMARFIIADITDPNSVPHELKGIVPSLEVPVKPIIEFPNKPYPMLKDLQRKHHWVLNTYEYKNPDDLMNSLQDKIINSLEEKFKEIQKIKSADN
ncbi:hypothetical protein BZZ01_11425 [Nostocales cyanobacterium HT-58-2]|nr:hypothetical protein BZZ01_11425 [Nostocales cyanobacterium HT-58-2]